MIGALTTNALNNVSKRDIIAPVRAIPKIYLDTHETKQNYEKAQAEQQKRPYNNGYSNNSYNPYFAAHILAEAGFGGKENNLVAANKAYSKRKPLVQNTIAIA